MWIFSLGRSCSKISPCLSFPVLSLCYHCFLSHHGPRSCVAASLCLCLSIPVSHCAIIASCHMVLVTALQQDISRSLIFNSLTVLSLLLITCSINKGYPAMQVRYEIFAKNCIAILFLYDVVTVAQFSHVVYMWYVWWWFQRAWFFPSWEPYFGFASIDQQRHVCTFLCVTFSLFWMLWWCRCATWPLQRGAPNICVSTLPVADLDSQWNCGKLLAKILCR